MRTLNSPSIHTHPGTVLNTDWRPVGRIKERVELIEEERSREKSKKSFRYDYASIRSESGRLPRKEAGFDDSQASYSASSVDACSMMELMQIPVGDAIDSMLLDVFRHRRFQVFSDIWRQGSFDRIRKCLWIVGFDEKSTVPHSLG
jgi:hypothetical protein